MLRVRAESKAARGIPDGPQGQCRLVSAGGDHDLFAHCADACNVGEQVRGIIGHEKRRERLVIDVDTVVAAVGIGDLAVGDEEDGADHDGQAEHQDKRPA